MRSAILSADGVFRWRLDRGDPSAIAVAWCMANPSRADHEIDDRTVTKVDGFTARWFGGARRIVVNKAALRSTDIRGLASAADPIGPENDAHIRAAFAEAQIVVFAWGPLAKFPVALRQRWRDVYALARAAGHAPLCFGVCKDGQPRHPLMTAYDTPPTVWERPA